MPGGRSLKIGEHQTLLHSFEGVPRWQLIPHLWESSWVNITCQGLQVAEVYTSRTWRTLVSRVEEDRRASCAMMQNLFGRWIPSYHQLIYSPWVLGYLVATGLLGLALTYYYDDVSNHKLQTILRVALQLAGLGLVAISTTLPEASAGICCLLLLLRLIPALTPSWPSAQDNVQHAAN
ncbi:hypothetical protein WJX84_007640, partial [Apatococcus fuscideae]